MDDQKQFLSGAESPVHQNVNNSENTATGQSKRKKYYVFVLALIAVFLFVAYQFYTGYLASRQISKSTPNVPSGQVQVKPVDISADEKNKLTNSKLLVEAYKHKAEGYVFPEFKIKDTGEVKDNVDYIKVYLDLGAKVVSINTVEYPLNKVGIFAELEYNNLDINTTKVVAKQKFQDLSWNMVKGVSSDTVAFYEVEKDGLLFQVSQYLENGLQKIIIQSIQ